MKTKELEEALRLVAKVYSDPRVRSDQRDQLLKARRELEGVARSGKLEKRKLFRAVELIASVLLAIVDADVTQR